MSRKSRIKIRHLNVVKNIYNIRNLKIVSDTMMLTPAAVSKTCLEFERIIGKTLFARTRDGFIPNEIAKRVFESSALIEKEIDQMIFDVDNILNKKNLVNISFQSNSIISGIMNSALSITRSSEINFSINYGSREDIIEKLLKGKTEIVFASIHNDFSDDRLNSRKIRQDSFVIFDKERIYSLKNLYEFWDLISKKIWILPIRGTAMRNRFDSILEFNDLNPPAKIIELNSTIGSTSFINHPDTIGISSISYLKDLKLDVSSESLSKEEYLTSLDVCVFWRKDSRDLIHKTVDEMSNFIIGLI